MISERQAEALLKECEKVIGKPLKELRTRLLRNQNTFGALWELLTLYSCLPVSAEILFEPSPASPDLSLKMPSGHYLHLEATTVESVTSLQSQRIHDLQRWLSKQFKTANLNSENLLVDIREINRRIKIETPPENKLKALTRNEQWRAFIAQIREHGEGQWDLVKENVRIKISQSKVGRGGFISAVPNLPLTADEHPVYRTIEKKGKQIKKWGPSIVKESIVLIVATTDSSSEFDVRGNEIGLEQAIYSALLDPKKLSFTDRYNILRDGTIGSPKSKKVSGARFISGVLFVCFKQKWEQFYGTTGKVAKASYFPNYHADRTLIGEEELILEQLDFNRISYGSGRETWKNAQRLSMGERNLRDGGGYRMTSQKDGSFSIDIPATTLMNILSGNVGVEKALSGTSQPTPLWMFKRAFEENREILNISYLRADPISREEDYMRVEFGDPIPAVIAQVKKS